MDTEQKLIKLIMSKNEAAENVSLQSHVIDIGLDSLKFIELVIMIELEFGIEFDDEDLDYRRFIEVKDIADYIEDKMELVCSE